MTDIPHEKRPYVQPTLQRLGDVASLTAGGSDMGNENMTGTTSMDMA